MSMLALHIVLVGNWHTEVKMLSQVSRLSAIGNWHTEVKWQCDACRLSAIGNWHTEVKWLCDACRLSAIGNWHTKVKWLCDASRLSVKWLLRTPLTQQLVHSPSCVLQTWALWSHPCWCRTPALFHTQRSQIHSQQSHGKSTN